MFIQMLEGLSKEEAELLVWAKDGELNKHYKGLDRKFSQRSI